MNTHTSEWHTRACPICDESVAITLLDRRTRELTVNDGVYIFEHYDSVCDKCGLVFNHCVPDEKFIREYYRTSTMLVEPNYDLKERLKLVKLNIAKESTIIEFGAGRGEFVKALNGEGYVVDGFDYLIDKTVGKRYDVALAYFILEHTIDPNAFIIKMMDALDDDGMMIIEVPDFEQFPLHSLYIEHLNHFTPQHLITLLTNHGLKLVDVFSGHSREYGMTAIAVKGLNAINAEKYIKTMADFEVYWQRKMELGHGSKLRRN